MVGVPAGEKVELVWSSDVTVTICTESHLSLVLLQFWLFDCFCPIFYFFFLSISEVFLEISIHISANVLANFYDFGDWSWVDRYTGKQAQVLELFLVVFKVLFFEVGFENEFFDAGFAIWFADESE